MSIESVIPSSHLILCHPLLLLSPIPPSIRIFSNGLALSMRWPKYWSFSSNISPSNEHPGLISFRMDWLDLLAVWGTRKSLFQHHSSKASILCHSAFFTVQLSHPYMTTGKTIALTRWTFVGKVISLLFNMLSMLNIKFILKYKYLIFICIVVALSPPFCCFAFSSYSNKRSFRYEFVLMISIRFYACESNSQCLSWRWLREYNLIFLFSSLRHTPFLMT